MNGTPALRRVAHNLGLPGDNPEIASNKWCSQVLGNCWSFSCFKRQSRWHNCPKPTWACSKAPLCFVSKRRLTRCSPIAINCVSFNNPLTVSSSVIGDVDDKYPNKRLTSLTVRQEQSKTICGVTLVVPLAAGTIVDKVLVSMSMGMWPSGDELLTISETALFKRNEISIISDIVRCHISESRSITFLLKKQTKLAIVSLYPITENSFFHSSRTSNHRFLINYEYRTSIRRGNAFQPLQRYSFLPVLLVPVKKIPTI